MNRSRFVALVLLGCGPAAGTAFAQAPASPADSFIGEAVPEDIARMVERAQQYLVREQAEDGRWNNPGGESGNGIQGLAILALLATGEDPRHGRFAGPIRSGLDVMLKAQDVNGYLGHSMYHHGFATLALAELYGTIDEPRLGPALQRAVALILDAQKRSLQGAWRYGPTSTDGDTTVSGAQIVALFAARNAGLEVPDAAIDSALAFLRSCQDGEGGIGYTSVGGGSGPRNAIAVVAASLAREDHGDLMRGAWRWLVNQGEGSSSSYYFYYIYYAAQAYYRADMAAWRTWNRQLASRLIQIQNARGGWDGSHGSTFCTASAILAMAPNFRYLPIYER